MDTPRTGVCFGGTIHGASPVWLVMRAPRDAFRKSWCCVVFPQWALSNVPTVTEPLHQAARHCGASGTWSPCLCPLPARLTCWNRPDPRSAVQSHVLLAPCPWGPQTHCSLCLDLGCSLHRESAMLL